jgi:serine/threonine protein kinase
MSEAKEGDVSWANIPFEEIEMGERLGGGGVGMIYRGWYKNEPVALKTLFDSRIGEDLKKEYMDELLVLSKVKHTNIVKFLGACMTPPNLCYVMELCEGSLFSLLHVDKCKFSDRDIIKMAVDVGSALEYLHSVKPAAIIHRDIKSHNILRATDGTMKLCDFGLVKVRSTQAGTPAYMAPELLENKTFNKSVDVYAFGILLCEMFTAEIPFYGVEPFAIRERVIGGDRPSCPSYAMPGRCVRLIQQCWSQRPEERPDFTTVVDELLEIYDELPEGKFVETVEHKDALEDLLGRK